MTEVTEEAHELVEYGLIREDDFCGFAELDVNHGQTEVQPEHFFRPEMFVSSRLELR